MSDEHTIAGNMRDHDTDARAVAKFSSDMLQELSKDKHTAHWKMADCWYFMERLIGQTTELRFALFERYGDDPLEHRKAESIIRECAKVAKYAMMIADNERAKLEAE